MNFNLFIQGLIEIGISFITIIIIFILSFKIFSFLTRDIDEIREIKDNNLAVGILCASFILGIMLLVKSAISPAMDTLQASIQVKDLVSGVILFAVIRILLIYSFSCIFAFIILWFAVKLFTLLTTEIDEMQEIKNNNISVSLLIGSLIVSMALIVSNPLTTLLNGMISPPLTSVIGIKQHFINMDVFLQGLIELGMSLVGVVFVFFISFKMFSFFTKNIDEIKELKNNNIAIGILSSSFVFGILLIVRSSVIPANEAFEYLFRSKSITVVLFLLSLLRIVSFFIISAIFAFIIIWLSLIFFMFITTNIDEISELKNKNIAVAIIVAILIISASLLIEHGVLLLLNGLIKTPEIGKGLRDLTNFK